VLDLSTTYHRYAFSHPPAYLLAILAVSTVYILSSDVKLGKLTAPYSTSFLHGFYVILKMYHFANSIYFI
jgi:hypothetical protein